MVSTSRTFALVVALASIAPAALSHAQAPAGGVSAPSANSPDQIAAPSNAMVGSTIVFSGVVPAAANGPVIVQRRNGSGEWTQTATATADATGAFTASWVSNRAGQFAVRAIPANLATASTIDDPDAGSLVLPTMTIYRSYIATYYGPGFFGHKTACGQRLRRTMLGVANKTLPCGTKVALEWDARTITVPVIDRGPYANHASFDLTEATAHALDMTGTETIGAVSLGGAPKTSSSKTKSSGGGASAN